MALGMPVVPDDARFASLNINAISGGQAGESVQSPCVADEAHAIFDRRFLVEEAFDDVKDEIVRVLEALKKIGTDPAAFPEYKDLPPMFKEPEVPKNDE